MTPQRWVRSTPLTTAYVAAVGTVTLAGALISRERKHAVLRAASTDLVNLRTAPARVLPASAFVLEHPVHAVALPVLALAMGSVERWQGSLTAAAVFASGHVGATLVVATGIAGGIEAGWLDPALRSMVDVGVSYGQWALLGALAGRLQPRWRVAYVASLSALLVSEARSGAGVTVAGHAVAWGIGLAIAGRLVRRDRAVGAARPARRATLWRAG